MILESFPNIEYRNGGALVMNSQKDCWITLEAYLEDLGYKRGTDVFFEMKKIIENEIFFQEVRVMGSKIHGP